MSKNDLRSLTKKELLDLARERDLPGRSTMDKEQLVSALEKGAKPKRVRAASEAPEARAAKGPARPAPTPKAPASAGAPPASAVPPVKASDENARPRTSEPTPGSGAARSDGPRAEPARPGVEPGNRADVARPDASRTEGGVEPGNRADSPGDRARHDEGDRGRRDRNRDRGRRRGRNEDRAAGSSGPEEDIDPWNRIDAADPNYGRFLNPQTADFRRGRGAGRPGRGAAPIVRNEVRGRPAQDRATNARDGLRKSGEARSGVAYTPMFDRPGNEDSRPGSARSRRSRRRDERRRRQDGPSAGSAQAPAPPRKEDGGNSRSGVELPRVWREDGTRRDDYYRSRDGRREPRRDGRPGEVRPEGRPEGRPDGRQDRRDDRRDERRNERRTPRDDRGPRPHGDRSADPPAGEPAASLDALGVIGPLDPSEVAKELRSMNRRPSGSENAVRGSRDLPTPSASRCRILARDPYWIHVFWELDEAHVYKVATGLEVPFEDLRWILRIHSLPPQADASGATQPPGFFDVDIAGDESSQYVHVGLPDRDYRVDIGLLTDRGLFCPLASSNRLRTPRDTMEPGTETGASAGTGPDAGVDAGETRFYEESGGSPAGRIERPDPPVLQRNLEASQRGPATPHEPRRAPAQVRHSGPDRHSGPEGGGAVQTPDRADSGAGDEGSSDAPRSRGAVASEMVMPGPRAGTSPGAAPAALAAPTSPAGRPGWVSSPGARPTSPTGPISSTQARPSVQGPRPAADRGFWLAVQTELVVSGATEPDAKVTIQGIPIQIRPDGSFTVRFELPDGEQIVPVIAVSRDGRFEKEITPKVVRETNRAERILRHGPEESDDGSASGPGAVDGLDAEAADGAEPAPAKGRRASARPRKSPRRSTGKANGNGNGDGDSGGRG